MDGYLLDDDGMVVLEWETEGLSGEDDFEEEEDLGEDDPEEEDPEGVEDPEEGVEGEDHEGVEDPEVEDLEDPEGDHQDLSVLIDGDGREIHISGSGDWFENEVEDPEVEELPVEEITLFGRYTDHNHKKNCVTISVLNNATVKEVREALYEEIGQKIKGMSIFNEVIDGDDVCISAWSEIQHGSFLDVYV